MRLSDGAGDAPKSLLVFDGVMILDKRPRRLLMFFSASAAMRASSTVGGAGVSSGAGMVIDGVLGVEKRLLTTDMGFSPSFMREEYDSD